jgi:hypothetical protein
MTPRSCAAAAAAVLAGCASIPDQDERARALAAETIDASYRVAVTSVLKKPDVSSMIGGVMPLSGVGLLFNTRAAIAEGSADEKVGPQTPLERIDAAMSAALAEGLGAAPEHLDRAAFGGDELAPKISNIAFEAFAAAKEQGFDALLFVHLQPDLASATGSGAMRLALTGTPVLKSARTDALLFFETYRVECAGYRPVAGDALAREIDACTNEVIARMSAGLSAAFAAR